MHKRGGERAIAANRFGARLSEWRALRRLSQLSLAMDANVSQRHWSAPWELERLELEFSACDSLAGKEQCR